MTEILSDFFKLVILAIVKMHYWGIGIGMALESACIPIPSEIILPFGGYLVSTGKLSFWGTVLAGTMGGTAGSALAYLVGRVGGRPFITRFGKYFFISPQDLKKAETWFAKYGEATAFFTRLLPIIRTFISLPCGIGKMNFTKFLLYTFLGSLPWSVALVYAGYKMGEHWERIRLWFHEADIFIIIAIAITLIAYYLKKKRCWR